MKRQIVTDRLIIRKFCLSDRSDLYEYLSDNRVVYFEPYEPITREQSQEIIQVYSKSDSFFAVCLQETGKVIGNLYFELDNQLNGAIGFVFHHDYQQQGYAYEAARALIKDRFNTTQVHRIYAQCNPDNLSSWRLLEKLGFTREGHLRSNIYFKVDQQKTPIWQDTYIYGLLEGELL